MTAPTPLADRHRTGGPRGWVITAMIAVLATAAAITLAPRPYELAAESSGDAEMAERVRQGIDDTTGYHGLSVALVEPDGRGGFHVRTAGLGTTGSDGDPVEERTLFGSASVAKVLPGMLLADMADRGELTLNTRVGELLPELDFSDPALADVEVEELATHTAGLTREETSLPQTLWQFAAKRHPEPPESVDDFLVTVAEEVRVDPALRGANHYSNTGVDLLGHALAAHAGTTYDRLVQERILDPLGMEDSAIWTAAAGPGFQVHNADLGRPLTLDGSEAGGPSGGLVTTAGDLGLLLAAVMEGSAPGSEAVRPVAPGDVERREQGLGWYVETLGGVAITGHGGNATTNGHTAWIGYTGDRGAVVLSNTHRFSEDIGIRLLGVDEPSPDNATGERVYATATILLTLLPGLFALGFAARRRPGRWWRRATDRAGIVAYGFGGTAVLAYAFLAGFWHLVSPWVWVAGVLLLVGAVLVGAHRWPVLPTARGTRP
ncbi:serine hydrolase [Nocardiopsis sp. N85]|uniref:serine hydrolase domain-containing protein n=1 Tax=Nocardiopsis sp. N85 TaxID=3029400 RepID=UPI00237F2578|nr:serine hydrolase domain-containing protein [Nocardiopsis sp. N85]MDE3724492.1 serine hydrolase [Nocardiopsis sp. N85]